MNSNQFASQSFLPFIGRVAMATIFLISGIGKLMAPAATIAYIGSLGLPAPALGYAGALGLELLAGVLLIVGLRTRAVAALLALYAIATAVLFHHALADQNQMFHFLKNLAMAGGLLQVVAFGAGAYSIDARQRSKGSIAVAAN